MPRPIPPVVAGEPPPAPWGPLEVAADLARRVVRSMIVLVASGLALPAYGLLRLGQARPPVVPSWARVGAVLGGIMREAPWRRRPLLLWLLAERLLASVVVGLVWMLDAVVFRAELAAAPMGGPVFEVSAARSGSTQLARYLEEDPRLCAPTVIQALLPSLAGWRLWRRLGLPAAWVRDAMLAAMPEAYLKRHEMDPARTDTFEVLFMVHQLGDLSMHSGPGGFIALFNPAELTAENREFWEDFLRFVDGIGRRALVFNGRPDARLFVKGHFLAVAPALAARHPDALFFTVIREPVSRLCSVINFHRVQPGDGGFGPPPWAWLVARALAVELPYDEAEQRWFQAEDGPRRLVIRFRDFVGDLEGTLRRLHGEVFGDEGGEVRRLHTARHRSAYTYDRTLAQLGLDEAEITAASASYLAWCGATDGGAASVAS